MIYFIDIVRPMVNATENDVVKRRCELLLDIEVCYFLEFANLNIGYY